MKKWIQLSFDFKPWDDEEKCTLLAPYRLFEREIWKDIIEEGFEGLYQGSNFGRIRSLYENHGKLRKVPKILKPQLDRGGYPRVGLHNNGMQKTKFVHQLIFEAFFGKIPNGLQVNHKDENKQNNILSNIDTLMTPKENLNWGTRNERSTKSLTNHPKKSKSVIQKSLQGEVIKIWESTHEIQRQLGYYQQHICRCCNGKQKTAYNYIWQYTEEKAAS